MNFAFCRVAISPIRAEQKDSSEMVSQLLFGEIVNVLDKIENWIFIETHLDKYKGWIDEKQIEYISKLDAENWLKNQQILTKEKSIQTSIGNIQLTMGAFIHKLTPNEFSIGNFQVKSKIKRSHTKLLTFAKSYLNTSYLWGGKTNYGIDCSGFTQIVFRNEGIELPRDASQQVQKGVATELKNSTSGDVAFFSNANGKIIHVGILLSKSKIIHASGRVKIDTIDENGIWSEELQKYSHTLHSIKRMI
jgi:cell wall-associated NlpC family hydrolase